MCGIIGYVGKKQAAPILLDGLKKLEYRGYDSAGMAVSDGGKIVMIKAQGRLKNLCEISGGGKKPRGRLGIGHTRWATHGEPSDVNSHPQISESGLFAIVHNGIIENYLDIKEFLSGKGMKFVSQTDTEVVAGLLEYYYKGDVFEAIRKTLNRLKGSYALGILFKDEPDRFYAVKKDSPLVIGLGEGENFIASDIPAVLSHTRKFVIPSDKDVAVISCSGVELFDSNHEPVHREITFIDWDVECAQKDGYPHFMLKEIHEQPKVARACIDARMIGDEIKLDDFSLSKQQISGIDKLYIVACGSSYHAGIIGKYFIERNCRLPVETDLASEFRYRRPILDSRTLTVVISQSGETADTIAALREAKAHGSRTLGIVNVVGSTIAREADDVLMTRAGPEISVATTKGYTTQVIALQLLGLYLARLKGSIDAETYKRYVDQMKKLPDAMQRVLDNVEPLQQLASTCFAADNAFFIGRGMDYALALEGALKLKEISYIHAECYAAGELKHGTISLIEKGSLTIACMTGGELYDKTAANLKEMTTRGANAIAFVKEGVVSVKKIASHVIELPALDDEMMPCVAAVALQLLAYYVALQRGCDIDNPKNLAKSVTVE